MSYIHLQVTVKRIKKHDISALHHLNGCLDTVNIRNYISAVCLEVISNHLVCFVIRICHTFYQIRRRLCPDKLTPGMSRKKGFWEYLFQDFTQFIVIAYTPCIRFIAQDAVFKLSFCLSIDKIVYFVCHNDCSTREEKEPKSRRRATKPSGDCLDSFALSIEIGIGMNLDIGVLIDCSQKTVKGSPAF